MVVPRLACRECPRLDGVVAGDAGLRGDPVVVCTCDGEVRLLAGMAPSAMAVWIPAVIPFGVTGTGSLSCEGVVGRELAMRACPSSDSIS